jgi:hypothetical protein
LASTSFSNRHLLFSSTSLLPFFERSLIIDLRFFCFTILFQSNIFETSLRHPYYPIETIFSEPLFYFLLSFLKQYFRTNFPTSLLPFLKGSGHQSEICLFLLSFSCSPSPKVTAALLKIKFLFKNYLKISVRMVCLFFQNLSSLNFLLSKFSVIFSTSARHLFVASSPAERQSLGMEVQIAITCYLLFSILSYLSFKILRQMSLMLIQSS